MYCELSNHLLEPFGNVGWLVEGRCEDADDCVVADCDQRFLSNTQGLKHVTVTLFHLGEAKRDVHDWSI